MESTIIGDWADLWGLGWIFRRADNFTHVKATFVFFHFKAEDDIVPGEGIFWVW